MTTSLSPQLRRQLIRAQRMELTEEWIYTRLGKKCRSLPNREVLTHIGADEARHAAFWAARTGADPGRFRLRGYWYYLIARILGITFGIRLLERGESRARINYAELAAAVPDAEQIMHDEEQHEQELINLIDEERLKYVSSMVLGMNDALVELTGALAGLTLALTDNRLVALAGLITGVAAAMSMASSEFLARKAEPGGLNPARSALYTGGMYIVTVALLVTPYLTISNAWVSLACTLGTAICIIAAFNGYLSVAREEPFWVRFGEMAGISLGVAAVSFLTGYLIRSVLGIDI